MHACVERGCAGLGWILLKRPPYSSEGSLCGKGMVKPVPIGFCSEVKLSETAWSPTPGIRTAEFGCSKLFPSATLPKRSSDPKLPVLPRAVSYTRARGTE